MARIIAMMGIMTQGTNFPGVFEYLIILRAAKNSAKDKNIIIKAISVLIIKAPPPFVSQVFTENLTQSFSAPERNSAAEPRRALSPRSCKD